MQVKGLDTVSVMIRIQTVCASFPSSKSYQIYYFINDRPILYRYPIEKSFIIGSPNQSSTTKCKRSNQIGVVKSCVTSAYVSIRHTSAYVIRQQMQALKPDWRANIMRHVSIRQHTSYVSIRHTPANASARTRSEQTWTSCVGHTENSSNMSDLFCNLTFN
jgi:hypothetical protein